MAGHDLAIPLAAIAEVLAWPSGFSAAPDPVAASLGLMDLRGEALEVLEPRRLLGLEGAPPPAAGRRVAVLRGRAGRLGIAVDALRGTRRLDPARLQARRAGPGAPPPRVVGLLRDGDRLTHLLDVEALLDLPGVAAIAEARREAGAARVADRRFVLLRAGGFRFALDAAAALRHEPAPALRPTGFRSEVYIGAVDHRGGAAPVVDLARLLDLPPHIHAPERLLLVRLGGATVGLMVHEVLGLRAVPADRIAPFPGHAVSPTGVADAILRLPGDGEQDAPLLLDAGRLAALPLLRSLARLHDGLALDAGAANDRAGGGRASFLAVEAGGALHVPLLALSQVLPADTPFAGTALPRTGMLGQVALREAWLPLYDLTWLLTGRLGEAGPDQRLLVADLPGGRVALRVERLTGIEHLAPDGPPRPAAGSLLAGQPVRRGGTSAMLDLLDLPALAGRLAA
nr:chemotaxis protein CheW [Neoroseomonas nitratireducens]